MDGYKAVISKYTEFAGRSRRKEYWGFVLINAAIWIVLSLVYSLAGIDRDANAITVIGWALIAVMGVYGLFVPLLTLIVAFISGNVGENQYGPDPKA